MLFGLLERVCTLEDLLPLLSFYFVTAPDKPVNLDLEACEQNKDIDFIFTGFEVTGKVSSITLRLFSLTSAFFKLQVLLYLSFQVLNEGTSYGPSGVKVTLKADGKSVQSATTVEGRYVCITYIV